MALGEPHRNRLTRLNTDHFDVKLHYHGIVWGLTPHGGRLGHTSHTGRITLHSALLDPQTDAWSIRERSRVERDLGAALATDVLLHEMIHALLFDRGENCEHNGQPWCDEIMRITPQLGLEPIKAAPVKPRRIDGKVTRRALDGHLSREDIAHWPHSLRAAGYYTAAGRIRVPI